MCKCFIFQTLLLPKVLTHGTLSLKAIRWLTWPKGCGSSCNSLIYSSISFVISAHWEKKLKHKLPQLFLRHFPTVGFLLHKDWMKPQSFSPAANCLCPFTIISDISEVIFGDWIGPCRLSCCFPESQPRLLAWIIAHGSSSPVMC